MVVRGWWFPVGLAVAAAMVVGATAPPVRAAPARTVPCQEIIDHPKFPYSGARDRRYRLVVGVVSAPPEFLGLPVALHERPWPYWLKAALVIRAGRPAVSINVPERWK